jgi:signal transduction histidine kinase
MAQERRAGRPLNPLSKNLDPAVFAFAERLRRFYANLGLTLTELEEPLGADATTLSRYLSGKIIPERGLLGRLYETVERRTGIAVHDDVRTSTNALYYAACAVLEPQRHALYRLRDEKDEAEHRADQAEETVEELRTELRSALGLKELAEANLHQLQSLYGYSERDARLQLHEARLRHEQLVERIKLLTDELRQALADLRVAVEDRDRLALLLQQAEAKLQAEIERRWSHDERPAEPGGAADFADAAGSQWQWLAQRERIEQLGAAVHEVASKRLPEAMRRLREADLIGSDLRLDPIPVTSDDEIGRLTHAVNEVQMQALRLASEQALLRSHVNAMFVNLARRSQSLLLRQLRLIDELENGEQDPDQLANLFKLDHLATRMRRTGENLLVLAGVELGRQGSEAMRLLDVMRAAASEVEQYERIALRDLPDVNVPGRVANDLVHLVAELLENATSFSPPDTAVTVSGVLLDTRGVTLEIEDAGIGMAPEELRDANNLLSRPPVIDVATSRRMGLYVVNRLGTRHHIQVMLRPSARGGVTAVVFVPHTVVSLPHGYMPHNRVDRHYRGPFTRRTTSERQAPGAPW